MVEVCEQNPPSYRYVVGKGRSICLFFTVWISLIIKWSFLIAFSNNCRYLLTLRSNLFKGLLQCGIWNYIIELKVLCYIKIHLSLHFEPIFIQHDFMISYIGRLEIIGSLSYTTLPNVNKFNCTVVNISSTHLIRWVCFKSWEADKLIVGDTSFQNSNFHFKSE